MDDQNVPGAATPPPSPSTFATKSTLGNETEMDHRADTQVQAGLGCMGAGRGGARPGGAGLGGA